LTSNSGEYATSGSSPIRSRSRGGSLLFLHNLADQQVSVDLSSLAKEADQPNDILADQDYEPTADLESLRLAGYGYRWIRLHRNS
jgi:maltose alpha-D-glucosyltransferase/alpha-amylase